MTGTPEEERQVVPFATVLTQLQQGNTHAELSKTLQELTEAVKATGKRGTLSLTLTLSESKAADALEVVAVIRSKLPEPKQFATIFYADGDNNLVRKDPRQTELELDGPVRVAPAPGKAANQ
jgi:hypothetical protein